MCGARAAFAHLNSLIAVVGGAALVACAVVIPGDVIDRAKDVPSARIILYTPYVAGPLLLILSHLGIASLHSAPRNARVALVVYAVISKVTALVAGALAGWSISSIAKWLQESTSATTLATDISVARWLRLFEPLAGTAAAAVLKKVDIQPEMLGVVVVCVLTLLLLLVNAALAVAARPRQLYDDEQVLRPCSSVYYEPSAPAYKPPPLNSEAWQ